MISLAERNMTCDPLASARGTNRIRVTLVSQLYRYLPKGERDKRYFSFRGFRIIKSISTGTQRLKLSRPLLNFPNTYTRPVTGQESFEPVHSPIAASKALGK